MTDKEDTNMSELSTSDNVTSIKTAKRKKKEPSEYKFSQGEVCRLLADAVSRAPDSTLPYFPYRYIVVEPKRGVSLPVFVKEDDSCIITIPKSVSNDIIRFCHDSLYYNPSFSIKPSLAVAAAEYYLAAHQPTDPKDIKAVRWADEPGLTYRRLPWRKEHGDTPTWNALLSRMSNAQAFIDWIGSLFFEEANQHNYVWIYGEGGDGKGAINRFLAKVFDTAYRSKTAPSLDKNGGVDKFWAYNLLGARLAVFPDCESATFTTSGFFKSLTGGDPVEVEGKGLQGFTTHLNTRYMILANVKPAITSAKSNIRRIIYCEMAPTEQDWAGIETRLWEEGGYFLTQCIDNYLSKYPDHGPLRADQGTLIDVIDENEQHLENFFNEYFELVSSDGYATAKEIKIASEEAWPRSRKTHREFLAWLKRRHRVDCEVARNGNETERRYYGVGRKKAISAQNLNRFDPSSD